MTAWEDDLYWQNTDKKILKRINALIQESYMNLLMVLASQNHSNTLCQDIGHVESMMSIEWCIRSLRMLFILRGKISLLTIVLGEFAYIVKINSCYDHFVFATHKQIIGNK